MIRLTEITSNQGNIAKKYIINETGFEVIQAPTIYDGTAKQICLLQEDVKSYFDQLAKEDHKCVVLGVHGELNKEYKLVKEDRLTEGTIARTQAFFNWANSGSISLSLLDFDSAATSEERMAFLDLLDVTLKDALIGETSLQRNKICRWIRPSSSASLEVHGKVGNGLHVFIPVKGCTNELTKLIHKFSWLHKTNKAKGYKVNRAGNIQSESLIDPMVGTSERVVYTSDAVAEGNLNYYSHIDRTCNYFPGGILDAELAINILQEATLDFDRDWDAFKLSRESFPDVVKIKQAWIKEQIEINKDKGMDAASAKKAAESMSRGCLLSSDILTRVGGEQVYVRDILADPESWIGEKKFNDPIKSERNRNVAMIIGSPESPKLKSFSSGGIIYDMKWTSKDLSDWVDDATPDEIDDWYKFHTLNSDISETLLNSLHKKVSKKTDSNVSAVKADIKLAKADKKEADFESKLREDPEAQKCLYGMNVDETASHGDVLEDYIRNSGECRSYGGSLFVWEDGSVWKEHNVKWIRKNLRTHYNHVNACQRKHEYEALSTMIVSESDVNMHSWPEECGLPCTDGFYWVSDKAKEGVEKIPYSKELGCRFKMGIKPDWSMKTPLFDRIIANVENKILFQQLFGLALSGYLNKMQMVFLMRGRGGEGKGTTCKILQAMLPTDRVTSIKLQDLNNEYYRATIAQSKVNIIGETRKGKIDLTGVKEITGGDLITARNPAGVPFSFYATCSFILSVNDIFVPEQMGPDIERRFGRTMVSFVKQHKDEEAIVNFPEKIIENELPGILAWAIEGIKMYFADGLDDDLSLEMYGKWVFNADPVASFLDEKCHVFKPVRGEKEQMIERNKLWDAYQAYSESGRLKLIGRNEFYSAVEKQRGVLPAEKLKGVYYYKGIIIRK